MTLKNSTKTIANCVPSEMTGRDGVSPQPSLHQHYHDQFHQNQTPSALFPDHHLKLTCSSCDQRDSSAVNKINYLKRKRETVDREERRKVTKEVS